jgi:predicted amidohydrolase
MVLYQWEHIVMNSAKPCVVGLLLAVISLGGLAMRVNGADAGQQKEESSVKRSMVRVAAAQTRDRTVDWRIADAAVVLGQVDQNLGELEQLVHKAADAKCDAIAFPEDTLGLLKWEAAHPDRLQEVLPNAVSRMIERLGRAASSHRMYLVVCNDTVEKDGTSRNTAFFIGRDGRELGHYNKVNLPISEQARTRGDSFPVFQTPDLGGVGMAICYDMMFPETTRCLALGGADVVFVPTLGGASLGEGDIDRAALRTRAADNLLWIIVAKRGGGSMVISPKGKVVAEANGADSLAIAEIEPAGQREAGDAFNWQRDYRSRLFRERVPSAYGILTDPNPPALQKHPQTIRAEDAIRIFQGALTIGEQRFGEADALQRAGKTVEAIRAFEQLKAEYPASWIDRSASQRLAQLHEQKQ